MKKRGWIILGVCLLAVIIAIVVSVVVYNNGKAAKVAWTEQDAIVNTKAEDVQAIRVMRIPEGGSEDDATETALTEAADIQQALELIGKLNLGKKAEAAGENLVVSVDTAQATYALSFVGDAAALESGEYYAVENLGALREFVESK